MDRMDFSDYNNAQFSSTLVFTPGNGSKTPNYLRNTKSSVQKMKTNKINTPLNATQTISSAAPNTPYPIFSPMRKVVKGKRGFTPATSNTSQTPSHKEPEVETMDTETPSSTKRKRGLFGNLMNKLFDSNTSNSPASSPSISSPKVPLKPSTSSNTSLSATTTTPLASKRMEKRRKQMEEDKENKLNASMNPNDEEYLKLKEEVAKIRDEIQTLKTKRTVTPAKRVDAPITRSQTIGKGLKEQASSVRTPSCKSLK